MIGPKKAPTAAVPRRWMLNRPISTASAIGTTKCSAPGIATEMPSTADNTEMAGVITASP